MKTRYTTRELANAWINRTSSVGTCSSNMRFRFNRFFSYRTCIAEVETIDDVRIVFVSDRKYSVTTSRHQRYVEMAIHDREVLRVAGCRYGQERVVPFLSTFIKYCWYRDWAEDQAIVHLEKADKYLEKARKCRVNGQHQVDLAVAETRQAYEWARIFKLKLVKRGEEESAADVKKRVLSARKRRIARAEKAAAKMRDSLLEQWRSGGELRHIPEMRNGALRIKTYENNIFVEDDAGHVATERAAKESIQKLFDVRRRLAGSRVFEFDELTISGWSVRIMTEDSVQIGCTEFKWTEIDRIAKGLGMEYAPRQPRAEARRLDADVRQGGDK